MIKWAIIALGVSIPVIIWLTLGNYAYGVLVLYLFQLFLFYLYVRNKKKSYESDLISFEKNVQILVEQSESTTVMLKESRLSKIYHQLVKFSTVLESHRLNHYNEKNKLESLIGDLSHQLKTPIANLKMYMSLLGEPEEQEKKMFYTALIKQCDHLEFLVHALMKLSKVEADCLNLTMKSNDLNQLILNAIGAATFKAEQKHINITYTPVARYKIFDLQWTKEALDNIIDNAIKYSPDFSTVAIECEETEMFTKICVSDEGIGVLPEDINKIFQRFYRGMNSIEVDGVGIGLYLAQAIMTEQGGYIYANRNVQGTTFELNIKN